MRAYIENFLSGNNLIVILMKKNMRYNSATYIVVPMCWKCVFRVLFPQIKIEK